MVRVGGVCGAVLWLALGVGVAGAQPPVPAGPRPSYSPYLNLVRRDAPPGINYYGLVRPQFATMTNLQTLQQQLATTQQAQQRLFAGQSVVNPDLPATGQAVTFLNTGGYFLNAGAGAAPVNPSVTTRAAPPSTRRR